MTLWKVCFKPTAY